MERLTIRNSDGSVSQPTNLDWSAALERLAAYEDTRLTPEEVEIMRETKADAQFMLAELCGFCDYDRLCELAQTEKEGRLLILPCKVGDTVYQTNFCYNDKATVSGYSVYIHTDLCNFRPSDIGKTVFFTHEEAEEALKEVRY